MRLAVNGQRALPRPDATRSQWATSITGLDASHIQWATSITWAGHVSQPLGGEHYLGWMRLAANGQRALSGLYAPGSQWATSITWAGCVSQPMGDEHYLGWMKNAQKIPVFFQ
jgi:hypothetical protein